MQLARLKNRAHSSMTYGRPKRKAKVISSRILRRLLKRELDAPPMAMPVAARTEG